MDETPPVASPGGGGAAAASGAASGERAGAGGGGRVRHDSFDGEETFAPDMPPPPMLGSAGDSDAGRSRDAARGLIIGTDGAAVGAPAEKKEKHHKKHHHKHGHRKHHKHRHGERCAVGAVSGYRSCPAAHT